MLLPFSDICVKVVTLDVLLRTISRLVKSLDVQETFYLALCLQSSAKTDAVSDFPHPFKGKQIQQLSGKTIKFTLSPCVAASAHVAAASLSVFRLIPASGCLCVGVGCMCVCV